MALTGPEDVKPALNVTRASRSDDREARVFLVRLCQQLRDSRAMLLSSGEQYDG